MQRYLLFDSGCTTCSSLARLVADESHGWLEMRSLREPAMQELLNRARPGWTWEPTLLVVEGEQVEVYTGWQLRLQMVRGLGLRQAGRIAQAISQFPGVSVPGSSQRRHFLKVGGAIVGGLALGLGFGLPKTSLAASQAPLATDAIPLALTDPVVAIMKSSRHVRLATKHFGAPDWSRVFKITFGPEKKTGYAVFLKDASLAHGDASANTVLIFGHELHPRHAGAKRQTGRKQRRQNKVLVFRMTADASSQARVEWLTPSARLVATSTVIKSGQVSNQYTHELTTVTPNAGFKCAILCPALTVACRADCTACAVAPTPVDCGACLLCVGAAGIGCYDCLTEGKGDSGTYSGSSSGGSGSSSGSGSGSGSGS